MEKFLEVAQELVRDYGYLGIFLIAFTESIIQPVPPDPFIAGSTAFGMNPLLGALVATAGSVLGGVTAYLLGQKLGEPIVKRLFGEEKYRKAEEYYRKWGFWGVVLAGFTPIPYKLFCWLSGIFELGLGRFILASLIGRFPRFLAVAYFGDALGKLF